MRNIIAVIIGVIVGGFFVGLAELVAHLVFPGDLPYPPPVTVSGRQLYMEQVPVMAQVSVLLGWASGAFIASGITSLIQGRTLFKIPLITVGILQLFAWMNMISFPHPTWMWIAGSLVFIPMGYFAFAFFRKRPQNGNDVL